MTDWQPIETAPREKDSTILAWDGEDVFVAVWEYAGLGGWRVFMDGEGSEPTHWMPLPKPPVIQP